MHRGGMIKKKQKTKQFSPWVFSSDQQYPGFNLNKAVREYLERVMNTSAGLHLCVGVVQTQRSQDTGGRSITCCSAYNWHAGWRVRTGAHRDAQSAAHYQQWQINTCRSLVVVWDCISYTRIRERIKRGQNCARICQGYPLLPEEVVVWRRFRHCCFNW